MISRPQSSHVGVQELHCRLRMVSQICHPTTESRSDMGRSRSRLERRLGLSGIGVAAGKSDLPGDLRVLLV